MQSIHTFKKTYFKNFLLVLILFAASPSWAQTDFFTEIFSGSPGAAPSTISSNYSGNSQIQNSPNYSGNNLAFYGNTSTFIAKNINSSIYNSISLSFYIYLTGGSNNFVVQVGTDGTNFGTTLTSSSPVASNNWSLVTYTGTIPSSTTLAIKLTGSTSQAYIDNLILTGVSCTAPVPTFSAQSPANVCTSGAVTLTASGAAAGTGGYQWNSAANGGGTSLSTSATYVTPVISANTTYYVRTTNSANGGCQSAWTPVTAIAGPPPAAVITQTNEVCISGSVALSASGAASGGGYRWYTTASGGTPVSTASTYNTPTISSNTVYYATTTRGTCESPTRTAFTALAGAPPAAVITQTNSVCTSGSVSLSATGAASGGGYRWYSAASGGTLLSSTNIYNTPSISSNTVYYVATTRGSCESSTRTAFTAVAGPAPLPVVTQTNDVCISGSVSLSASGAVSGGGYRWYSVASGGTAISTTNTYNTPDISSNTIFYAATTKGGCESSRTAFTAVAGPAPSAVITQTNSVCSSGSVALSASGTASGGGYRWYTAASGGTPVSTASTYNTPTISSNTVYYATTTRGTCESQTRTAFTALAGAPPIPNIAQSNTLCSPGQAQLTASGATSAGSYRWYNVAAGGTPLVTTANYTTPVIATNTTYYATTLNGTCESGRSSFVATVNNTPTPTITQGSTPVCSGSVALTASGAVAGTGGYRWYSAAVGGTLLASTATYNTPVISANTNYYATTTNSATSCESSRILFTTTMSAPPVLSSINTANSNLVTWYQLNGNANDVSGNGNTGSLQGTPTPTADRRGVASSAYILNGSSQYISTTTNYPNPNNNTIGIWFRTSSSGPLVGYVDTQTGTTTANDRNIYVGTNGYVYFGVYNTATASVISINSGTAFRDGQWHFAVATLSGTGMKLYVDGVLRQSVATPTIGENRPSGGYWRIGNFTIGSNWPAYPSAFFNGSVDDVYIFNGELSAAEILSIYNSYGPVSYSGPVCIGNNINLSAPLVNGGTYSWTGPNGYTSTAQNPSFALTTTNFGTYTLRVSTAGTGCTSNAATVNVAYRNVSPTVPTITTSRSATMCVGCTLTLTSSATTNNLWSNGATTRTLSLTTAAQSGNYSVTVTDANSCSLTSVVTPVTITACASNTWSGTTNAWTTTGNWSKCAVPVATDDVIISGTAAVMPQNTASVSIRGLTINSGATLTNSAGGTLNLSGNFINNGTYTDNNNTVFNGGTAQSVTGATSFKNLTINKSSNAVTLNSATTVNGILELTTGTLASGGNLNVNLNTGLISGTGSGSITGNIRVFKDITNPSWHYLSAPLTGMTAAQINDNVPISNGFYSYYEGISHPNPDQGWNRIYNTATPLNTMQGYILNFPAPALIDYTGPYTHVSGTYSISGTHTPSSDITSDGWNFVGNPYPSPIDWTKVTRSGVDNAVYLWDPINQIHLSYVNGVSYNGGTQFIPSMQAFQMHVTTPNTVGSISITDTARVTTPNNAVLRKSTNDNLIKLTVSSGKFYDETLIQLLPEATSNFDPEYDAYKLTAGGENPSLYTKLNNTSYCINTISEIVSDVSIPVKIDAAFNGQYTIMAEIGSGISEEVFLFDKALNINHNLKDNYSYTCNIAKGDTNQRFFINFKSSVITGTSLGNGSIGISYQDNTFTINLSHNTQNIKSIQVFTSLGRTVFMDENVSNLENNYEIHLDNYPAGVYLLKIEAEGNVYTRKVVRY